MGWKKYYWLDIEKFCKNLIKNRNEKLVGIKYFTARITNPPDKVKRQSTFLDAISTLMTAEVIERVYYSNPIRCNNCNDNFYCKCGRKYIKSEEKRSDVNIAISMLCDAFDDSYDIAYLISGDSDLVPVIEKLKNYFPKKEITVFFPPNRASKALKQVCDQHKKFFKNIFKKVNFLTN